MESVAMSFKSTRVVRIEWGDCDPAGIIFYPVYFKIFDNATAMLFERALDMNKNQYLQAYDFAGFPLVDTRAQFIQPTRFGDDVSVESTINFGKSSFTVEHKIMLNATLCAECTEKRVWVARQPDGGIKATPVPEAVLAKFR
jgi:4-hydroxybenzoyl-CoA thioesterase